MSDDDYLNQLIERHNKMGAMFTALLMILLDKGIFTQEEYDTVRLQSECIMDQVAAKKQEEMERDA